MLLRRRPRPRLGLDLGTLSAAASGVGAAGEPPALLAASSALPSALWAVSVAVQGQRWHCLHRDLEPLGAWSLSWVVRSRVAPARQCWESGT